MGIYSGYNYYEQILKIALGEEINIGDLKKMPCASILFHVPNAGILEKVDFPAIGNAEYGVDYELGTKVKDMQDGTDRIGQAIVWSEDMEQLETDIKRVLQETIIEVRKDGI